MTLVKLLTMTGYPFNLTTNAEGLDSVVTAAEIYGAGDYVVQLRAGHDNQTGTTLDTVGFTIVVDP